MTQNDKPFKGAMLSYINSFFKSLDKITFKLKETAEWQFAKIKNNTDLSNNRPK